MFVSIIKYSRKCSSFYFLIMSQNNTYKICLLIKLDIRDQGQKNNAVSVKVTRCRNSVKIEQLAAHGLIELLESTWRKLSCFSLIM